MTKKETIDRYNLILVLRKKGFTFAKIASVIGVSQQRVSQISKGLPGFKEPNPIFIGQPAWRGEGRERVRFMARARDNFRCRT